MIIIIYAVIGPTGVGKTTLSIKLAKNLNAEIINCDSMQIYKELNIGTAKITDEEMEGVKHHMLSIKSINDTYNCFLYQQDARRILDKLLSLRKNVVLVGGTGLYLKALLYDYDFKSKTSKKVYDFKLICLTKERQLLYEMIDKRVDIMMDKGLLEEVYALYKTNKNNRIFKTAIGYKEFIPLFENKQTLDEVKEKIKQASRNYAKRQFTFFKHQFSDVIYFDTSKISMDDIIKEIIS